MTTPTSSRAGTCTTTTHNSAAHLAGLPHGVLYASHCSVGSPPPHPQSPIDRATNQTLPRTRGTAPVTDTAVRAHPQLAHTHIAGHVRVLGQRRRHLHERDRLGCPHCHGRRRPRHWPGRHPLGGAAAQHRRRGRDKGAHKRHGCNVRWGKKRWGWGKRSSDRRWE